MKRSVWRGIFWISLILLFVLLLFTVGVWAMGNVTGAMAGSIMESVDPENFGYRYLSIGEFIANSVGSPIFYICIADIFVLALSIVGLVATPTKKPE